MANRLTDKDKKKIIADYIENQNFSETARSNSVDEKTVRRIIKSQNKEEMVRKAEQKKEENTKDILEYMDSLCEKQKKIIDLSLEVLEEKLSSPDIIASIKDVATVYGVIIDKALKYKEMKLKEEEMKYKNTTTQETLDKLDNLLEAQKNAYMD